MIRYLLFILLFLSPALAEAANCYVRDGGTATGTQGRDTNGGSWSQAYDQITTAETNCPRGDTIYVADGTYNGGTFNTNAIETTTITVRKATAAVHGTETGWLSEYGDGQAIVDGQWNISTCCWVFDGATRDESNPPYSWESNRTAYGFRVGLASTTGYQINLQTNGSSAFDNITLQYIHIVGYTASLPGPTTPLNNVQFYTGGGSGSYDGVNINHNLFTGGVNHLVLFDTIGALVEYNAFTGGQSGGNNHGESINLYGFDGPSTTLNATIRYNYFKHTYAAPEGSCCATAVITQCCNGATHFIYGNLFDTYGVGGSDGFLGFSTAAAGSGDCVDCWVVNNTTVHGSCSNCQGGGTNPYGAILFGGGSGNRIQNNLFFDSGNPPGVSVGSGATTSHNGYGGSSSNGTSAQTSIPTSIFTSYAGDNLKLASGTTAGATLTNQTLGGRLQTFDTDMLGCVRGADGTWDRGAFEFNTSGCGAPAPVSGLRFEGTVGFLGGVKFE